MFDIRIPGTGWVEGRERPVRHFDKNGVGGINQAIREQVEQQKTRERLVGIKRAIGERENRGS